MSDCLDTAPNRKITEEALRIQTLTFMSDDLKLDTWTMPDMINAKVNLFVHDKLMPEIFGTCWPDKLLTAKRGMMTLEDYADNAHWSVQEELKKALKNIKALIDSSENAKKNEASKK